MSQHIGSASPDMRQNDDRVTPLHPQNDGAAYGKFFDNFEYLQALEAESLLLVMSKVGATDQWPKAAEVINNLSDRIRLDPNEKMTRDKLKLLHTTHSQINAQRILLSKQKGISLHCEALCQIYGLDLFEKKILLLLFFYEMSSLLKGIVDASVQSSNFRQADGLRMRDILEILCRDITEQMKMREHFCADSRLVKDKLIVGGHGYSETSSPMDDDYTLHQRILNQFVGDDNVYSADLTCVKRTRGHSDLDQVILPLGVKDNIVRHAEAFVERERSALGDSLKDFFGYGTGLTFLFHGPSGTGKTMMAHALARHLDRQLISLDSNALSNSRAGHDDVFQYIFQEAKLSSCIVFFDECDDFIEKGSWESGVLLMEMEKSDCITILSTNRSLMLDPAMERRISHKVYFGVPDSALRKELWDALTPNGVNTESAEIDDVAQQYRLTGGLIKNSILEAINSATHARIDSPINLTKDSIVAAVRNQTDSSPIWNQLGWRYSENDMPGHVSLSQQDQSSLREVVNGVLVKTGLGRAYIVTCQDIPTARNALLGPALNNKRDIRVFSLIDLLAQTGTALINPYNHSDMLALDYAFLPALGKKSLMVIEDSLGTLGKWFTNDDGDKNDLNSLMSIFETKGDGIIFLTLPFEKKQLPSQFVHRADISAPPEGMQFEAWTTSLGTEFVDESELVSFINNNPLHVREIEELSKYTLALSKKNPQSLPPLVLIDKLLRMKKRQPPILFGSTQ